MNGQLAVSDEPIARFDDLISGEATLFAGCEAVLETANIDHVAEVLAAAEQAAARGLWAVGFVSYEAAPGLDLKLTTFDGATDGPALSTARHAFAHPALPLAWFGLFRARQTVTPLQVTDRDDSYRVGRWTTDVSAEEYMERVAVVGRHLDAGDTYQCNYTYRLATQVSGDLFAYYRALALAQRGAHHAFIDTGRFTVASASPELFFEWSGESVLTRPMKGTTPRGRSEAEDRGRRDGLAASAKDRAENVMIVDLLRNDLGRIARFGSVAVPDLFTLERYETVWQMTSTVRAEPRPGTSLVDLFRALFPCGSVTGAPKRRTMQIIAGLEASPRGLYCGAIGIVAPPGASFRARFSVAIRTLVIDRTSGLALYGTGGGITVCSDPAAEYAEALAKTAILTHRRGAFGLIETMAVLPDVGIVNRSRHMARLASSAAYFGFSFDESAVATLLDDAVSGVSESRRLRLVLDRDGKASCTLARLPVPGAVPVRLVIDSEPVLSTDPFLCHKTTRRDSYERLAKRHPEADDVIMVNERGEVTEVTIANLLAYIGGQWWTPPLSSGCLPGVERARLLDEGLIGEQALYPTDLLSASAIGVASSLRGFRRAVLLGAAAPARPADLSRRWGTLSEL